MAEDLEHPPSGTIRVSIVEDDRRTREGLRMLVDGSPGYRCAATFSSVEDALRSPVGADVVLLDINLPGISGSDGVRLLKQKYPAAQIVMLTVYADQEKVFESICNGAVGYLLRETPVKLLEAIREAFGGGAPMSPEIARQLVTLFQKTGPPDKIDQQLTPQEVRLLQLLADGYRYDAAARRLTISLNTVRNYVRSSYEKLHVHSKSEAVTKALRHRVIS